MVTVSSWAAGQWPFLFRYFWVLSTHNHSAVLLGTQSITFNCPTLFYCLLFFFFFFLLLSYRNDDSEMSFVKDNFRKISAEVSQWPFLLCQISKVKWGQSMRLFSCSASLWFTTEPTLNQLFSFGISNLKKYLVNLPFA